MRASRTRTPRRVMNDALRQHQGRPRGAARRRPDLHDARCTSRRAGRLAAHHVPHAGRRAVLGRHLFPARKPLRPARLSAQCCARSRRIYRAEPEKVRKNVRRADRPDRADSSSRAAARSWSDAALDRPRAAPARQLVDRSMAASEARRNFRNPPFLEFPVARRTRCGSGRSRSRLHTLDRMSARRHLRSSRRRLRALFASTSAGSCRISRRCSTTMRSWSSC